jgi:hypothetical protein
MVEQVFSEGRATLLTVFGLPQIFERCISCDGSCAKVCIVPIFWDRFEPTSFFSFIAFSLKKKCGMIHAFVFFSKKKG